jgi:hypothetical protein
MFLMVRNLLAFVVIGTLVAVLVLWAAFSYGGPAVSKAGDRVSNWIQQQTDPTTTTTP